MIDDPQSKPAKMPRRNCYPASDGLPGMTVKAVSVSLPGDVQDIWRDIDGEVFRNSKGERIGPAKVDVPVRDVPIGTPATKCEDDGKHWNTAALIDHSQFWKYSKAKLDREFRDAVCASLCIPASLLTEPKTTPTKANNMQTPVEAAAKRYSENKYSADMGSQLVRAADMATLANEYGWLKIIRDNSNRMSKDLVEATKKLREVEKEKQILNATIAQHDESLAIVRRLREQDCKLIRELQKRPEMQNEMVVEETIRKLNKIIDGQVEENRQLSATIQEKDRHIKVIEDRNENQRKTICKNYQLLNDKAALEEMIAENKRQVKCLSDRNERQYEIIQDQLKFVRSLENANKSKDVEIEGLRAQLKPNPGRVEYLHVANSMQASAINELRAKVAELEGRNGCDPKTLSHIAELEEQVSALKEQVKGLETSVLDQQQRVGRLQTVNNNQIATIQEKDRKIGNLEATVSNQSAMIRDECQQRCRILNEKAALEALVKQKDENAKIHAEIIESKDFMIKVKNGTIRELNEQIEQLQAY